MDPGRTRGGFRGLRRRGASWLGVAAAALAVAAASAASSETLASGRSAVSRSVAPLEAALSGRLSQARVLPYPLEHVWPTAIRYLRVDRGFVLVDRDEEAGFILFDFPLGAPGEGQKLGRGSLEAFATKDAAGRASVRVQVSTTQPSCMPCRTTDRCAIMSRAAPGLTAARLPASTTCARLTGTPACAAIASSTGTSRYC